MKRKTQLAVLAVTLLYASVSSIALAQYQRFDAKEAMKNYEMENRRAEEEALRMRTEGCSGLAPWIQQGSSQNQPGEGYPQGSGNRRRKPYREDLPVSGSFQKPVLQAVAGNCFGLKENFPIPIGADDSITFAF